VAVWCRAMRPGVQAGTLKTSQRVKNMATYYHSAIECQEKNLLARKCQSHNYKNSSRAIFKIDVDIISWYCPHH